MSSTNHESNDLSQRTELVRPWYSRPLVLISVGTILATIASPVLFPTEQETARNLAYETQHETVQKKRIRARNNIEALLSNYHFEKVLTATRIQFTNTVDYEVKSLNENISPDLNNSQIGKWPSTAKLPGYNPTRPNESVHILRDIYSKLAKQKCPQLTDTRATSLISHWINVTFVEELTKGTNINPHEPYTHNELLREATKQLSVSYQELEQVFLVNSLARGHFSQLYTQSPNTD